MDKKQIKKTITKVGDALFRCRVSYKLVWFLCWKKRKKVWKVAPLYVLGPFGGKKSENF